MDGFDPQTGNTFDFIEVNGQASLENVTFQIDRLEPGFEFTVTTQEGSTRMTAINNGIYKEPPEISLTAGFTEEGKFTIDIKGAGMGEQFQVQQSLDLTEWNSIETSTQLEGDSARFVGELPSNETSVFYRVVRDL